MRTRTLNNNLDIVHFDRLSVADHASLVLATIESPRASQDVVLVTEREWNVGDLAKAVGLSQSALSQHLSRLRHARLVDVRRDRQTMYYSCKDARVIGIFEHLGLTSQIGGGVAKVKCSCSSSTVGRPFSH